jgi:hypothetical protein
MSEGFYHQSPDGPVIKEQLEVSKNILEVSKKTHRLSWAILIVSILTLAIILFSALR